MAAWEPYLGNQAEYCKACKHKRESAELCEGCPFDVVLAPENLEAWELWNRVQTQWKHNGFAYLGLDYSGVKIVADCLDIPYDATTALRIQALERMTMKAFNSKKESGK